VFFENVVSRTMLPGIGKGWTVAVTTLTTSAARPGPAAAAASRDAIRVRRSPRNYRSGGRSDDPYATAVRRGR
jgi:hypothetical protein